MKFSLKYNFYNFLFHIFNWLTHYELVILCFSNNLKKEPHKLIPQPENIQKRGVT